jgi:hypothetical protein
MLEEEIMTYEKDVHTEHCCLRHGCKYGDDDCTVATGQKPQSYPCEECNNDNANSLNIHNVTEDFSMRGYDIDGMLQGLIEVNKISPDISKRDLLYYLRIAYESGYGQGCYESTGGQ